MERTIVINADDFGLCEGVNKGIVQAHTKGVLTSATLMANMPAAQEAVEIAKGLPNLGVGVHLNLTEGKAISKGAEVDCIVNSEGEFAFSASRLALLAILKGRVRKAIETELAAQIQWVIDKGIKPTHLDSHKHIHSFPVIFPIVCRLAKRFDIRAIRYVFEPRQICRPPWPASTEKERKNAKLLRTMGKINRLQDKSFFNTEALLGVAHTGKIDFSFLRASALYNPVNVSEIMTHPGFTEGLDKDRTRLVGERKNELYALCGERTKQSFNDAGIRLVHYGQL